MTNLPSSLALRSDESSIRRRICPAVLDQESSRPHYRHEQSRNAMGRFAIGMAAALGAIFLVYMLTFVLRMFGVTVPFIHTAHPIGIAISVAVVIVAALCLVLDFDFIYKSAQYGAPKYMEWYGAFALMTTLVWLYLEILRLLSYLQND